ncbi:MAG: DUF354 domain-containing protein, partial [Solirubrobacterales bacterium]
SRPAKARSLASRTTTLMRRARARKYDLAIAHGSVDLALVAATLRIPAATMFDYEYATLQHHVGCRAARRVLTPDAIPESRLAGFGAKGERLAQYPGLKEEYYLADFEPDRDNLAVLDLDPDRLLVVVRPPPAASMYHHANPLYGELLTHLAGRDDAHAVVLPRTEQQRAEALALDGDGLRVPGQAVDGQTLVAEADLVVSAGGTMNREAVALGTPVYTTFSGKLGAVDEQLIAAGRLRPLRSLADLDLRKADAGAGGGGRVRRDPAELLDRMLGALD